MSNPRRKTRGSTSAVHPDFTPEKILMDLVEDPDRTLASILSMYTLRQDGDIQHLRNRIGRWKKQFPEFADHYDRMMNGRGKIKRTDPTTQSGLNGAIDPDTGNWQQEFTDYYIKHGSRRAAASNSPYTYSTILGYLSPGGEVYDAEFAHMVRLAELTIAAEAEDTLVEALREAVHPKDKAWIASKYLESMDKARWGREQKIIGKMSHSHRHQHELVPRNDRIKALFADQKNFLELPQSTSEEPIEVDYEEVIEAEREAAQGG